MAFKKLRGAIAGFVGSVSDDINGLSNSLSGLGNKFDSRISGSLSDLLTGLTGTRTSNIPAISAEVLSAKNSNREARAKVLNDPGSGRGAMTPGKKTAIAFPPDFATENGKKNPLTNYIHFRSLERKVQDKGGESLYDIFLYVPDTLTDNLSVTYKEAEKAIVEGLTGGIFGDEETLGTSRDELFEIIKAGAPGADILKQTAGKAINPLKFQLFEGVNFRTYSYTFNLRPKNSVEASAIQNIIYAFKLSALPGTTGTHGRVYTFPNEWAIRFRGPFKDSIDYPLVSVCTGVDVDYAGGQAFATMHDGRPTSVNLTVNFTETSTLNRDKYKMKSSSYNNQGSTDREQSQEFGSNFNATKEQFERQQGRDAAKIGAQKAEKARQDKIAEQQAAAKEGPL